MPVYNVVVNEVRGGHPWKTVVKFEMEVEAQFPLAALAQVYRANMVPEGPQFSPVRKSVKAKKVKGHGANLPKPGLGQW